MQIDLGDIEAAVHHQTSKGVYIVKVGFPKLGMWMNGWTVETSPKYPERGLWVQPPRIRTAKGYMHILEFRKDSFFDFIRDEILRAVDRWNAEKAVALGTELTGDDLEEAKNVFSD